MASIAFLKRTFTIGLLIFVGALSCTLPLRYSLKQAAKEAMRGRLEHENSAAFRVFTESELSDAEWEDRHEFRLRGILYDIAHTDWKDGARLYHCVSDELEMKVEQDVDDQFAAILGHRPGESPNSNAARIFDWLQNLYFQHDSGFCTKRFSETSCPAFPLIHECYIAGYYRRPAKPPEA